MWRNSVFIFALVATALQLTSCLEGDDEINSREKRQAVINIQFRPRDKAALVSIGDSPTLVQLTSYNDPSAVIPATFESVIDETDSFTCDLGLQTLTSPSLPAIVRSSGIVQCSIVSNGGQDVDVRRTNILTVNETAGQLYLGPSRALFIESGTAGNVISTLANAIPTLPPVLPPLDITVVERSDQLFLNLRVAVNPEERPLDRNDDVIQLTGSSCSQVEVGQSVNYRMNGRLQVRQGLTIVREENSIPTLDSILERSVLGRPCLELSRDVMTRADFLPGQGWLCVGGSGLDMSTMAGFFTDSTSTMNDIVRTLVEMQLTCSVTDGQPALMGTFSTNANMIVLQLSVEDQMQFLDSATTIQEVGNNAISITDSFNQNLATFQCPSSVTVSIYDDNTLMILGSGLPNPLDVTNERIVAVSNPNDCSMVFVYPRRNSEITNLIRECRSRAMITAAPPISYGSAADGFGGSTFTANGDGIFSASSASAFSVGSGQLLNYDGNTIMIMNQDGGTAAQFTNVGTFTSNTATNRIDTFSGSSGGRQFAGPGTLYVDNDGRSFFTSVGGISNFISSIRNNVQRQRVDIVPATVGPNMTRVLNLQIGGNSFFTLPESSSMFMTIDEGMFLVYRGGTLDLLRGIRIPSSSSLMYTPPSVPPASPSPGFLRIINTESAMNFTNIQNLFISETIGANPTPIGTQRTLAGGGVLFRGATDNILVYLPSPSIVPDDFNFAINIANIDTSSNIDTLASYNGANVQVFNGSALRVIDGPGLLGFNNGGSFFTGDTGFIQRFSMDLARLRPVSTSYMSGTGSIVINTSGGDTVSSFSVGSRILQAPTGALFYSGGNIRTSGIGNNLIAGGITMLTTFDGFFIRTLTDSDMNIELEGGGLLVIDTTDPDASTAFYVTNRLVAQQVTDIVRNAMATFRRPDIVNSEPADFTSKLNEVNTGFGQLLTVYEGADVNLRCNPANANPPAEITFFSRVNFTAGIPFVRLNNSVEEEVINGPNDVTLRISNVSAGLQVEYMCMARNAAGVDSSITRVTVLPRVPLAIDNDLFTAVTYPNEAVVTARSTEPPRNITPVLAPLNDMLRVADMSLLISRVSIGCKATGRPKADIVWMMQRSGDLVPALVNLSAPTANVTSRRAGQSVLTIDVEELQGTVCTVYTCVASNNRDSVRGSARVCPQRFNTEGNPLPGPCSASCGIGVRRVNPAFSRSFDGMPSMTVTFADLPPGLVKDQIAFCSEPECPAVEFAYVADDFDNCTNFCGRVTQMRNLTCMRMVDGMPDAIVNLMECRDAGLEPPPTSTVCDMGPCPVYVIGPYGPCSRTCNGGTQTRPIECRAAVQDNQTGIYSFTPGMTVEIEICYNYSLFPRPSDTVSCNSHIPCLVTYRSSAFGECDPFFCQVRDIFCSLFDPYDPTEVWRVSDEMCMEQGLVPPHTVRSCGGGVCNFGIWTTMDEGNCSRMCGVGVQERTVLCTNRSDSSDDLEEGFCDARQRPADQVECFERNCPGECVREPIQCRLLRSLRLCKMPQVEFIAVDCCISCPLQASPIPPLPEQ